MQNFIHWHVIIPSYNPVITLTLIIMLKICTWGWVYMETISIVLCRALWDKLRQLEQTLMVVLSCENEKYARNVNHDDQLSVYRNDYIALSDLTLLVSNYVSPLILCCYMGNIYIIIVMLFNWIGPFNAFEVTSKEEWLHVCFSFFQISFRVALVTFFAAEVYQMSNGIRKKMLMFPNKSYSISVS